MEELRSTEVLDLEIRNESRRKADRIIAKAHSDAEALMCNVDDKVQSAKEEAEKNYARKMELFEKNSNASIPLEKQRYLVSYIHDSVLDAMNGYFKSIGKEKRLSIVREQALAAKELLEDNGVDQKVDAVSVNMDPTSVKNMLQEVFGDSLGEVSEGKSILLEDEKVEGFDFQEGVIISTQDGRIKCSLSLDQKIREILEGSTGELAQILFGGRLPE